jgi:hypothetical protein
MLSILIKQASSLSLSPHFHILDHLPCNTGHLLTWTVLLHSASSHWNTCSPRPSMIFTLCPSCKKNCTSHIWHMMNTCWMNDSYRPLPLLETLSLLMETQAKSYSVAAADKVLPHRGHGHVGFSQKCCPSFLPPSLHRITVRSFRKEQFFFFFLWYCGLNSQLLCRCSTIWAICQPQKRTILELCILFKYKS